MESIVGMEGEDEEACVHVEEAETDSEELVMEGVASIALLPCGSMSGHFIHLPKSTCYGLHGVGKCYTDITTLNFSDVFIYL